jgi:septal ring factor EnvC (AmiA/AmiB activator)
VHVGDTPPVGPAQGQLWYKTVAPVGMFIWFVDTDSGQWVQTSSGSEQAQATARRVDSMEAEVSRMSAHISRMQNIDANIEVDVTKLAAQIEQLIEADKAKSDTITKLTAKIAALEAKKK